MRFLLFSVVIIFFSPVIFFDYFQDDTIVFLENKFVRNGFFGISDILINPRITGYIGDNDGTYRPIPLILNALEFQLFGTNSLISHLVNLILYAILVINFFELIRLYIKDNYKVFLITLFFALMPIHLEVICNVKCRDELLGAIFFILAYLNIYKSNYKMYLCFILAFLSKESTVILLPISWILTRKIDVKLILISLGLVLWHYFITKLPNKLVISSFEDNVLLNADYLTRAKIVLNNLVRSFNLFFGLNIRFDYSFPVITLAEKFNFISIFVLLLLLLTLYLKRTRLHSLNFLLSWLFISNLFFLIGACFAERLLLIPSIFFCLLLFQFDFKIERIVLSILILFNLLISYLNLSAWKDVEGRVKFTKTLNVVGVKDLSLVGIYFYKSKFYKKAQKTFYKRLDLNPEVDQLSLNLLATVLKLKNFEEGKKLFIDLYRKYPTARYLFCVGILEEKLGNLSQSKGMINQAVSLDRSLQEIYTSKQLFDIKL